MSLDTYIQATLNAFGLAGRSHYNIMLDHLRSNIPYIGKHRSCQGNWLDHLVLLTVGSLSSQTKIGGVRVDTCLDDKKREKMIQDFISMILNR
ncbi:hypothetical protein PGT21_021969 [Puccinia graminis f. sp. tritici]|uniref:Uncharacterized protein n=1 Tax=Puccinia graminis f. sp. tritici TaxID=56615 RepID=A0A5B0M768_PUCGR|nr:hypothetical protein PGT21_021969 [Puccinia graminis f. sp. tritici]